MALTIVQHPDASVGERAGAAAYIAVEGAAHTVAVVGTGVLLWEGGVALVSTLCLDDGCSSEIQWMEQQLNRVGHIMDPKHAWDQLTKMGSDLLTNYKAVQPYIQQAIDSGSGTQISDSTLGPVMEYVATIEGQQVVVRGIQLADGAIQITDAWVKTK